MTTIVIGLVLVLLLWASALTAQREEETMDMQSETGFEYKIVRTSMASFRHPATLSRVLEEERVAGWELLEKLDDCRIRLKRSVEHRSRDGSLTVDPYRSTVGVSPQKLMIITFAVAMVVLVVSPAFFLLVAWITGANR